MSWRYWVEVGLGAVAALLYGVGYLARRIHPGSRPSLAERLRWYTLR